jgi:hypothetical protein
MASFDRRGLITGALTGVLAVALLPRLASSAIPGNSALRFNILRNGKPFGNYQVNFVTAGDQTTVTTEVAMSARIAGLTVFDYKHHCQEIWRGGRFAELHSTTQRDKDPAQFVSAVRGAAGISVTNKSGLVALPPNANPLTHWNVATLQGPLFNPEDGYPLSLTAVPMGRDAFPLANGAQVQGDHWALRGAQQLDEWYDAAGVWTGLRGVLPDRSTLEYRRV